MTLKERAQRANETVRNRTRNEITGVGQPYRRLVADYGTHIEVLRGETTMRPEPSRRYPSGHIWNAYAFGNGGDGTLAYGQVALVTW